MPNPKAEIDLVARAGKFKSTMGSVRRILNKVKARMQGVARAAKYMLVGQIAAIGGLVALAAKQEKAEAKLAAILKATGNAAELSAKQIKAHAAELQKLTTFGDETIINMQAILASFKLIKGDIFKQTTEAILDMSAALGTDLQASVIQVGKALNDPILGVSALARVGVTFTAKQKAMIKAMVETNDVAGAQTIILKELQSEFGGTAAAIAKTSGGKLLQLKNELGDMGEVIGKALIPGLLSLTKRVQEIIGPISKWVSANGELVLKIAAATLGITLFTIAIGPMITAFGAVAVAAQATGAALAFLGSIATIASVQGLAVAWGVVALQLKAVAAAAWLAVAPMLRLLANPVLLGLAAFAAGVLLIVKHFRSLKKAARDAEQASRDFAESHARFFGRERQEDIAKFADAETKAQNARSRHAREQIAITERLLAESKKINKVRSKEQADQILEERKIMRLQIDSWTRIAEAAEASAARRIAANKKAAQAEAEAAAAAKALADQRKAQAEADAPILANREKAMERIAELDRDIFALRNRLTPEQQEIFDLEGLEGIDNIIDSIVARLKEKRALEADKTARAEAEAAETQRKESLIAEGKALALQVRTKKEILKDERERLKLLRDAGAIEKETYERALKRLDVEEKIKQARVFGIESLEGALSRIAGAAASPVSGAETVAVKETAANTKKTVEKLDGVVDGLKALGRGLADIFIGKPNIAVFS